MARKPSFKPKLREQLAMNNKWDRFYALMGRVEPQCQTEIAPKRAYTKREGIKEADVNTALREFFGSRTDLQIWRNNRGVATASNGATVRYGVGPNGAADWIGYKIVKITPEMVGLRLAVFCAVEAKRPGGNVDPKQRQFVSAVVEDGGLAGIAESVEQAQEILG